MADLTAFRAKTATFASVSLLALQDVQIDESGQTTDLTGDGNPVVQGVMVDQIATEVTVTVTDIGLAANTSIEIGDNGSLVILFEKRADGRGAAVSGNKTCTLSNAVVVSKGPGAPSDGKGTLQIRFRCPQQPAWT